MKIASLSLVLGLFAVSVQAEQKEVQFETGVGIGGVVSQGNTGVSDSPAVKAEVGFNIGDYLTLGVQAGQVFNFNQKDKPEAVKQAEANPQAFASPHYHHTDGDVVVVDNDTVDVQVNVINSPVPPPAKPVDMTESSYFFGEPFARIGIPFPVFGTDIVVIRPYGEGFYGFSDVKVQSGHREIGTSYGYGAGVAISVGDGWSFGVEAQKRKIEINKFSYDHLMAPFMVAKAF